MAIKKLDIKAIANRWWRKIRKIKPFYLAGIIFLISILFPGEYSLWNQIKLARRINALEREKKEIIEQIDENRLKLEKLHSDKWMLEKFAREEFMMKAEEEDIYIIDSDQK